MSDYKEVTWIDAANACAAGTHDVQDCFHAEIWHSTKTFLSDRSDIKYRIREKVRTITVTIPLPYSVRRAWQYGVEINFSKLDDATAVFRALQAAIEGANDGR